MMRAKIDAGLSVTTVRALRTTLRIALNVAMVDGLIQRNVAAFAKPPKAVKRKINPFTPEEARAFLAALNGHRLEALFTAAIAMGPRLGELLGLALQKVDLISRKIQIIQALQRAKAGPGKKASLIVVPAKNDSSRRTLKIPLLAYEALLRHFDSREKQRELAGGSWRETGYLFTTKIGTPLDERRVQIEFTNILKSANLRRIRIHDLRHSAASLLIAHGANPKQIQSMLGHASVRLTLDLYGHLFPDAGQDIADRMDSALAGRADRQEMEANTDPVAAGIAAKPGGVVVQ